MAEKNVVEVIIRAKDETKSAVVSVVNELGKLDKELTDVIDTLGKVDDKPILPSSAPDNIKAVKDEFTKLDKELGRAESKVDKLKDTQDRATRATKGQDKAVGALKGQLKALGAAVLGTVGVMAAWSAATDAARAATDFYKSSLDAGFQYEKWEVAFDKLLGGSKAATEQLEYLTKFAASTPFQLPQVIEASKLMEALGLDTKEYLETLGDVSSFLDRDLKDAVLAFGNAARGEYDSLKTFGVDIAVVFERAGIDINKSTKRTAEDNKKIIAALTEYWQEKFGGGMEAISKTASGKISNISDAWWQFKLTVSQAGIGDTIKAQLTDALDEIERLATDGTLKQIATDISDIAVEFVLLGRAVVNAGAEITKFATGGGDAFDEYILNLKGFRGALDDIADPSLITKLEGIGTLFSTFKGFDTLKGRGLDEQAKELGILRTQLDALDEAGKAAIISRTKERQREVAEINESAKALAKLKEAELASTGMAAPFTVRATSGGAALVAADLAREISGLPPLTIPVEVEIPELPKLDVENAKAYTGEIKQASTQLGELMARFEMGPTFDEMIGSVEGFRDKVEEARLEWAELQGFTLQTDEELKKLIETAGELGPTFEESLQPLTALAAELKFLQEEFGLGPTFEEMKGDVSDFTQELDLAKNAGKSLTGTLLDGLTGGAHAFANLGDSIGKMIGQLVKAIAKVLIFKILMKAFGGGPLGFLFGKSGGTVPGGAKYGGTIALPGFHSGGVVPYMASLGASITGASGPDRVPLMASGGEIVLPTIGGLKPADVVSGLARLGDRLEAMMASGGGGQQASAPVNIYSLDAADGVRAGVRHGRLSREWEKAFDLER